MAFAYAETNKCRMATSRPSIFAAWLGQYLRRLTGLGFSPLDGPSVYAAWRAQCLRRLAGPVFTPLSGPSVYPAWRVLASVEETPPRCGRRLWQAGALPV